MKKNDTMKRITGKLAAIVALLIGLVGWGFVITEYILYVTNPPDPSVKISLPDLLYLVKGLGFSVLSAVLFAVEGIRSIIRATRWAICGWITKSSTALPKRHRIIHWKAL